MAVVPLSSLNPWRLSGMLLPCPFPQALSGSPGVLRLPGAQSLAVPCQLAPVPHGKPQITSLGIAEEALISRPWPRTGGGGQALGRSLAVQGGGLLAGGMGSVTQRRAGDDRVLFRGSGGAELDALPGMSPRPIPLAGGCESQRWGSGGCCGEHGPCLLPPFLMANRELCCCRGGHGSSCL